jgi:hypothetical protein
MAPHRKWVSYDGATGWTTVGRQRPAKSGAESKAGGTESAFTFPNVKREPYWKCAACSFGGNWRGRTHCFKCNTQAPEAHIAAVLLEAVAQQLPATGTSGCSAPTPVGSQEQAAILRSKQAVLDAAKKAGSGDAVIALLQADRWEKG